MVHDQSLKCDESVTKNNSNRNFDVMDMQEIHKFPRKNRKWDEECRSKVTILRVSKRFTQFHSSLQSLHILFETDVQHVCMLTDVFLTYC